MAVNLSSEYLYKNKINLLRKAKCATTRHRMVPCDMRKMFPVNSAVAPRKFSDTVPKSRCLRCGFSSRGRQTPNAPPKAKLIIAVLLPLPPDRFYAAESLFFQLRTLNSYLWKAQFSSGLLQINFSYQSLDGREFSYKAV